jgi:hypothetical protein
MLRYTCVPHVHISDAHIILQAPILCEMASFVASCCEEGVRVAKGYCDVAEQWATELEHELSCSKKTFSSSNRRKLSEHKLMEQKELQAKITMCHYLVVVACGCSAAPGTVSLRNLGAFAHQLCKHMLLVSSQLVFHQSLILWRQYMYHSLDSTS